MAIFQRKPRATQTQGGNDLAQMLLRKRLQNQRGVAGMDDGSDGSGTFDNVDSSMKQNFGPDSDSGLSRGNRVQPNVPSATGSTLRDNPLNPVSNGQDALLARQRAQEEAKRKAKEKTEAWKVDHPGEAFNAAETAPSMAGEENSLDQMFRDYLDGLKQQGTAGRDALSSDLDSQNAQALLRQQAAAGAAGLGLSGAAQSLQGGLQATQGREKALALDSYDQNQRQQMLQGIDAFSGYLTQRQKNQTESEANKIAIDQLEIELNKDLNGDGLIGTTDAKALQAKQDQLNQLRNGKQRDLAQSESDATKHGKKVGTYMNAPDRKPYTGDKNVPQHSGFASWDQYVGSDANWDYFIAGADGIGVKKGDTFKVKPAETA